MAHLPCIRSRFWTHSQTACVFPTGARRGPLDQARLLPGLSGYRCVHRPHISARLLQTLRGCEPQTGGVHRCGDRGRLVVSGGGQRPVCGSRRGEGHTQDVLQRWGRVAGAHREVCVLRWVRRAQRLLRRWEQWFSLIANLFGAVEMNSGA